MSITSTRWFCFVILFIPHLSYGEPVRYNLLTDPGNPQIVQASADTSAIGIFSLEQPRTVPFSNDLKAPEVQCNTGSGRFAAEYGKEIECKEITWPIHFDRLGVSGENVSEQRNLYSPTGWWVLFEWGDIPRLKGNYDVEICAILVNAKSPDKCRALPKPDTAPLIMSWGRTSAQKIESNIQFNIYADNSQNILNDQSWSQLMSQYNYLQQLLSVGGPPNKGIDIIWVGIDADIGFLGGATGSQAFISNYAVENNQVSRNSLLRLHWVSGHEIFHMLSTYSYPLWITESLAHYYGYKSLSMAGVSYQTPVEIWESSLAKMPHASTGLYEANEMVENENDMSYYGLFYDKGAAFWQELDNELTRKETSLDEYIALLSEGDTSNAQLNRNFTIAIEKVLGNRKFAQLVSKYLL